MFAASRPADGRVRVKICGITNAKDALAAIDAGADALGWNFFPGSRRFIPPKRALAIISDLPPRVEHVAVVVNPTFDEAVALANSRRFVALQLHGEETSPFCARLAACGVRFAKAIAVGVERVEPITAFATDTVVLDSRRRGEFGGTGSAFPWEIGRELCARYPVLRIVLAGGLTPENVAEAIRIVRPFGVDVTTGVEAAPGRKDHARMREFVAAAKVT